MYGLPLIFNCNRTQNSNLMCSFTISDAISSKLVRIEFIIALHWVTFNNSIKHSTSINSGSNYTELTKKILQEYKMKLTRAIRATIISRKSISKPSKFQKSHTFPQSSDKVVGLNPILVSECVAYLRQPKSLREEGIFRVPGDLNQINYFIKQYDYSIKTDIEDELDPNTIASVLKNHIRDKGGFVSKKEAAGLFDASRQKNIEEISNIVAILPKEFQKMMKEVFFLFKEVTQHEKENKMSAGTIATSCGLSIFPILNAGNANLMLKCMIDNAEEIFPE